MTTRTAVRLPAPNRVERALEKVSPAWARRRWENRVRLELARQYRGSESTRLRSDWVLSQVDSTPDAWELQTLRNRSRDLNRNDPVASGATDTMGVNVVGGGLRLQSQMRPQYLGLSEEQTQELRRQAEGIWQAWCRTADAGDRLSFDDIQFLAFRKILEDGEILALPVMADDEWRPIKRAIELVEAHRLATPMDRVGRSDQQDGIRLGPRGEPQGYYIYEAALRGRPGESAYRQARDDRGRPRVLHVFPTKRPGQLRGIPFFAPVLTYFKDLADYLEAEVVAARVAACLAVFMTKQDPYAAAYGASTDTESGAGRRLQSIEPGLVHYLGQGEGIEVVDPKRPGDSFGPFVEGVLRIIGQALGLPYELLVKDFSKTNYSSARAALLEGRRMFTTWRRWFAAKLCQPVYDLVIEEAYLRGLFKAPDFYRRRDEYTRALWLGGAWGWVDPVKEVDASRKAIDYGLSTLAEETAAQGRDWEEVLEQQRREYERSGELEIDIMRSRKDQAADNGGVENAETKEE